MFRGYRQKHKKPRETDTRRSHGASGTAGSAHFHPCSSLQSRGRPPDPPHPPASPESCGCPQDECQHVTGLQRLLLQEEPPLVGEPQHCWKTPPAAASPGERLSLSRVRLLGFTVKFRSRDSSAPELCVPPLQRHHKLRPLRPPSGAGPCAGTGWGCDRSGAAPLHSLSPVPPRRFLTLQNPGRTSCPQTVTSPRHPRYTVHRSNCLNACVSPGLQMPVLLDGGRASMSEAD